MVQVTHCGRIHLENAHAKEMHACTHCKCDGRMSGQKENGFEEDLVVTTGNHVERAIRAEALLLQKLFIDNVEPLFPGKIAEKDAGQDAGKSSGQNAGQNDEGKMSSDVRASAEVDSLVQEYVDNVAAAAVGLRSAVRKLPPNMVAFGGSVSVNRLLLENRRDMEKILATEWL